MIQILDLVSCGGGTITIDEIVPNVVSSLVTIIQIVIPIFLIVFGMLDMGKAVMTNDEKVMKEAQGKLIKRVIYAIIVFFVVAIVQFVVGVLNTNETNITDCIDCFINGECD